MSETVCAECGLPFTLVRPSAYIEDGTRCYHAGCGDPFGVKARQAELFRLRSALDDLITAAEPFTALHGNDEPNIYASTQTIAEFGPDTSIEITVGDLRSISEAVRKAKEGIK